MCVCVVFGLSVVYVEFPYFQTEQKIPSVAQSTQREWTRERESIIWIFRRSIKKRRNARQKDINFHYRGSVLLHMKVQRGFSYFLFKYVPFIEGVDIPPNDRRRHGTLTLCANPCRMNDNDTRTVSHNEQRPRTEKLKLKLWAHHWQKRLTLHATYNIFFIFRSIFFVCKNNVQKLFFCAVIFLFSPPPWPSGHLNELDKTHIVLLIIIRRLLSYNRINYWVVSAAFIMNVKRAQQYSRRSSPHQTGQTNHKA